MNGSLLLNDETWFGSGNNGGFGNDNSKKCPFWATRKRN